MTPYMSELYLGCRVAGGGGGRGGGGGGGIISSKKQLVDSKYHKIILSIHKL